MKVCPVCNWPLNRNHLKTHVKIKHSEVDFLIVRPFGNQFKMQILHHYPAGDWMKIGEFWRKDDGQRFVALGQGIYAGEVDEDKLSADIAEFLGLGKRVL